MDTGQELSPILTRDLESILPELEGVGGVKIEANPELAATAQARPRRFILPLAFGAGLLLGWLVVGWWLWPVQWTNSNPWQLQPKFQRTYVTLVAEEFWRTLDVFHAKESLVGWDRAELRQLLDALKTETTDAQARRHLAALADALDMPGTNSSWVDTVLGQRGIIVGAFLVIVPLGVALALVIAPQRQRKVHTLGASPMQEAQPEMGLDELLADAQLEIGQDEASQAQEGQAQAPAQAPDQGEQEQETDPAEREEQDPASALGDLASLFEEEDTSLSALEVMCKGLQDIPITDLTTKVARVIKQLRESNALRAWDPGGRAQLTGLR